MYRIRFAVAAKRRLRKRERSGAFDKSKFLEALDFLARGIALPTSFDDHQLKGALADLRECHLGFDLLMVYRRNEVLKIITITDTGTHDELFG